MLVEVQVEFDRRIDLCNINFRCNKNQYTDFQWNRIFSHLQRTICPSNLGVIGASFSNDRERNWMHPFRGEMLLSVLSYSALSTIDSFALIVQQRAHNYNGKRRQRRRTRDDREIHSYGSWKEIISKRRCNIGAFFISYTLNYYNFSVVRGSQKFPSRTQNVKQITHSICLLKREIIANWIEWIEEIHRFIILSTKSNQDSCV